MATNRRFFSGPFAWRGLLALLPSLFPFPLSPLLGITGAGFFLIYSGLPSPVTFLFLSAFSLPVVECATYLLNTIVTYTIDSAPIIGYDFKEGIPKEARTLVVMPCLLVDRNTVDRLVRTLEEHSFADVKGEIYFALLTDWCDSRFEVTEADTEILDYAKRQVSS